MGDEKALGRSSRRSRLLCVVLLLAAAAATAAADELTCTSEERIEDGGVRSATLTLLRDGDRLVGLRFQSIESFAASGNPMAVWQCAIDTGDPELYGEARWTPTHDGAEVTVVAPGDSEDAASVMRVAREGSHYRVSFGRMSAYYCGNSSFPKRVVAEEGKGACTVEW